MFGARLGRAVGLGGGQRGRQTALQVASPDEAHGRGSFGEALDPVAVPLAGRLPRDAQVFADHRPGVPGHAHLPYDLVDGRVRLAGQILGDVDGGVQQGEFVVAAGTGAGRCDGLLHGGSLAHVDSHRLSTAM
ncbi:hypothetical protein ACFYTG_39405 [Streptomyces mirabilis]|uniref:hypothetical protein n=1 Tax=Streptomyces mirabilis TaxID=68239 RepID=UPI0036738A6A